MLSAAGVNEQHRHKHKRLMAKRMLSGVDSDQYNASQIQDICPGDIYVSQMKYKLWTLKIPTWFSSEELAPASWKLYIHTLEEFGLLWIESTFVRKAAWRKDFISFTNEYNDLCLVTSAKSHPLLTGHLFKSKMLKLALHHLMKSVKQKG